MAIETFYLESAFDPNTNESIYQCEKNGVFSIIATSSLNGKVKETEK